MRRIFILLAILLLGFGCVETKGPSTGSEERLTGTQAVDLDGDSISDYIVYSFAPVTDSGTGMVLQRQVMVTTRTTGAYTSINPNLTDVDLLVADQSLDEFSKSVAQARTACGHEIGITNVVCADINTCDRLCAAASTKCRRIASSYDEALGGAMISYVRDTNEISSLLLDARRMVLLLRTGTDEDRAAYMAKTRDIVAKVADVNANPLYTSPDLQLCTHSDFGIPFLLDAVTKIGDYTTENATYSYTVVLTAKPTVNESTTELMGVTLADKLPGNVVKADNVTSAQQLKVSEDALNTNLEWSSAKASDAGYVLVYGFSSELPPDYLLPSLRTPGLTIKTINLALLAPTSAVFQALYGITGNYYLAFGAAIGLTLAVLLIIYNVFIVLFSLVSERAGGMTLTTAVRRAFGRADITWKTDIVIAVIALAAGYYVSTAVAEPPAIVPEITNSLDFLLQSGAGMVGVALAVIGVVMLYLSGENAVKIAILERTYGMVIKQEKDLFLAKAAALKDRLKELEALVDKYRQEDFDVGKEYDVLTSISAEKIDALSKTMTARSKSLIDEELMHVESALSGLNERKRIADENWPKWKEHIAKVLEEQNEIYASSLVAVPASLRQWALSRYIKESAANGMVLEHDAIKRKKIAPDQMVRDLMDRELIEGAIVIKSDKIVVASFAGGGETVKSALALKLRNYLKSLAKNLGQSEPNSFAALGGNTIIAYMRGRGYESVLFMGKDRFRDAIDQWKAKMKLLEGT